MFRPLKNSGFSFDVYQQKAAAPPEPVGTIRMEQNGDMYRLCRAGAAALHMGYLGVAAAWNAAHVNETASVIAIGEDQLTLTVTAGTAITENQLLGGALAINAGTGQGQVYEIVGNTAITAAQTSIIVTLARGLKTALDATSRFTLAGNPYYAVAESVTQAKAVGVPLMDITASYYYWAKTRGWVAGYCDGAIAAGAAVIQSNGTAGAMEVKAGDAFRVVGEVGGIVTVTTEFYPIHLCID